MASRRFPKPESVSKDEIPEILTGVMNAETLPVGPDLVRLLALWGLWMKGRGFSGGTGDWFVRFLRWALKGRVKAFVEWVEAHPSADGDLALAGIRQVYDFTWPHNASCGYTFHAMWGWLQLELGKPGEKPPPSVEEQMDHITRDLAAQGMRVKGWASLGPGGVMGIPEPTGVTEPTHEARVQRPPHRSEEEVTNESEAIDRGDGPSDSDASREGYLLEILNGLTIVERIETIARDVVEKTDNYRFIDVFELAEFLEVPQPDQPENSWIFIKYMEKLGFDEILEWHGVSLFETDLFVEKLVDVLGQTKSNSLVNEILKLEDNKCNMFGKIIKKLNKNEKNSIIKIANEYLFDEMDPTGNVIARYCIKNPICELNFEGDIEDDGHCIFLRGPYDYRDDKFVKLENCLTEEW